MYEAGESDSFAVTVGLAFGNAVLHYVLYRLAVGGILLVKTTLLWLADRLVQPAARLEEDESGGDGDVKPSAARRRRGAGKPSCTGKKNRSGDESPDEECFDREDLVKKKKQIMSNDYNTSWSAEVYRLHGPLEPCVIPAQPPLRTGVRVFCPDLDTHICKPNDHHDFGPTHRPNCRKIEKKDESVQMNRQEYMAKAAKNLKRRAHGESDRLKSTYQVDFVFNKLTYDCLMDQVFETANDELKSKGKCITKNMYSDPLPFKKIIDTQPLLV